MTDPRIPPSIAGIADWATLGPMLEGEEKRRAKFDSDAFIRAMRSQVAGQDHFLDELAKVLKTYLNRAKPRPNKPKARFLFLGRSGTGKTELGKAVANFVFPKRQLLHISCETLPKDVAAATTDLFGSTKVYTNAKRGLFARELATARDRVILLDEIEKAPPDIFNSFMSMLDEGRIRDLYDNETVDFTRSIVIMTCNANPADYDALEKMQDNSDSPVSHQNSFRNYLATNNKFRPELLARIDRIFVFKRLDRFTIALVVVTKLKKRVEEHGMRLNTIDNPGVARLTHMVEERMEGGLGGRAFDAVIDEEIDRHLQEASDLLDDGDEAAIHIGRLDDQTWLLERHLFDDEPDKTASSN